MEDLFQLVRNRIAFEAEISGPILSNAKSPPAPTSKIKSPQSKTDSSPISQPSKVHVSAPSVAAADGRASASPDAYQRIESLIPSDSPLSSMTTLEEVEAYVANTDLIPLDASRTNPVFGVGNPNADLLVIGEAPGRDEDRQGEPFVGRAGQLLNKILEAVNFAREDVYIANILKSRPPDNRNPTPIEVAGHIPILHKQIALIRPKLILCVGKTAGTSLLDIQTSLAKMRGQFHDYHGLPVLVTYHPAALLRNPQWKRPTWEDVQLLRERHDELIDNADAQSQSPPLSS